MQFLVTIAMAMGLLGTQAETVAPDIITPFDRPVVVSGKTGSAAATIFVETESSNSTMNLVWVASDIIDRTQSSITIEVDQQPIRTMRLSSAATRDDQEWNVPLGVLSAGPHLIAIKTHLEVEGDPCLLRFEKETWLRVEPATTITLPRARESKSAKGVGDMPALWKGDENLVQLVPTSSMSSDSVLAVLEASAQLTVWGFTPTLSQRPNRLVLVSLEDIPQRSALAESLLEAPKEAVSVVELEDRVATIITRRTSDLATAVRQLAQDRARSMCPKRGPCLFTAAEPVVPVNSTKNAVASHEAVVLDFRSLGYKHGFVAEGSGSHTLRFVWRRPANWTVTKPAELHLNLRLPETALVDPDTTTLSVRVNEQPISTWHLYRDGAARSQRALLKAKVPMDFASDDALSFEVAIHIGIKDEIACETINDEALWLVAESTSKLVVERQEKHYDGLSAYFQRTESIRPRLVESAYDSWSEVLWLASILQPFVDQTREQRWQWDDEGHDGPTILAQSTMSAATKIAWIETASGAWWHDEEAALGAGLISVDDSVRLSATGSNLTVQLGRLSNDAATQPDYSQLATPQAVFTQGRWLSVGLRPKATENREVTSDELPSVASAARIKSDEEKTLRRVNLAWGGLAGTLFIAAILYWRRKPRAFVGNIEAMNDKDNA